MNKINYVVITGVSSGIGYASTAHLIRKGFHVFGSVRRDEDAKRLISDFGDAFTPLIFDITNEQQIKEAAATVKLKTGNQNLTALINNAGIAVSGPLMHIPITEVRYQMDVNFFGLLRTTQLFLPLLGTERGRAGGPGRIIIISSVSGRRSYPFIGPYTASKHALEAISDSLRVELLLYGIDVIIIEPGYVDTLIWEKIPDIAAYKDTDYFPLLVQIITKIKKSKKRNLPAHLIAQAIYHALSTDKPKTRYLLLKNKLVNWTLIGLLPDRLIDKIYLANLKKVIKL